MYTVDRDGDGRNDSEDDGVDPRGVQWSPVASSIGTRLKERFAAWAIEHPCADCRRAIDQLNQMTADDVESQRDRIVADIVSRSQKQANGWFLKLAVMADSVTGGNGAALFIGRCVDDAIAAERQANRSQ